MFFKLLRIACKLSGLFYASERVRGYLRGLLAEGKDALRSWVQRLMGLLLVVLLLVAFLHLGIGFLLYGIAQWLNTLWASSCLGFLFVAACCFLGVFLFAFLVYRRVVASVDSEAMVDRNGP